MFPKYILNNFVKRVRICSDNVAISLTSMCVDSVTMNFCNEQSTLVYD